MLAVCTPYNEEAPSPGNGNMVAIAPGSKEMVDKLYAKALELGGADEGEPGQRMDGFYGGYFRDPDGNKICFCQPGREGWCSVLEGRDWSGEGGLEWGGEVNIYIYTVSRCQKDFWAAS